jgi:uncharacterized membrane protein YedE/YeeE
MMGFGAMLAGGCAVGAGVTGGMVFSLTAWISLAAIWISAMFTDRVMDGRAAEDGATNGTNGDAVARDQTVSATR